MIKISAIFLLLLCSCDILKAKRSVTAGTTAATKVDSGTVRISESNTEKGKEYERTTVIYPPRDTTITKNFIYPQTVIYEKGKEKENTYRSDFEGIWLARLDTLSKRWESTEKTKETKVLGFWHIAGIAAAVCLVVLLIFKLKFR